MTPEQASIKIAENVLTKREHQNREPDPGWISVEERLPDTMADTQRCPVCGGDGAVVKGYCDNTGECHASMDPCMTCNGTGTLPGTEAEGGKR